MDNNPEINAKSQGKINSENMSIFVIQHEMEYRSAGVKIGYWDEI